MAKNDENEIEEQVFRYLTELYIKEQVPFGESVSFILGDNGFEAYLDETLLTSYNKN